MTDFDLSAIDVSNVDSFDNNAFNSKVIEEFRANGGKVGGVMTGKNLVIMTTTGAKTGQKRLNPVAYVPEGDRVFVIASNGGKDNPPAWYFNLKANPELTVEIGTDSYQAVATEISGTERDELYARMAAADPAFAAYETKTDRKIPVIELARKDGE
ncbi:nitroreductase family deazaflavin-dependent oxidoreductase [Streptomyces acidicola]|uniref:nitroreductase family deazaflavin-dependent oxidoreductase n=1 Tax=Streptomyces acidicola TaxID=2596892 RepID=UPI00380D9529